MKVDFLGNITNNLDSRRIPLNQSQRRAKETNAKYPYIGANGILGYINEYIFDDKILCVAEDGGSWGKNEKCSFIVNEKCWVNNHAHVLSAKDGVSLEFIKYYLNSINLNSHITGSTRGKLNKSSLNKIKIPQFSFKEQKRIATILDKTDALRQKNKQLLAAYDELLQSVFLELFGNPVRNEQNWPVKLLSDVSVVVSGVTKGRKLKKEDVISLPYIRVANVQDGHLDLNEIKTIDVLPKDLEKYRLLPGDILLTEGGDPDKLGRGAVWKGQIEDCIHQNHIFRVRIKDEINLTEDYLSALIGSAYGKRFFLKASKQTTGIASINSTQLKKFPVIMAPMELQRKFKSAIENIEAQKALVHQNIKESEDLFNGLVQKAFKGELTGKKEKI